MAQHTGGRRTLASLALGAMLASASAFGQPTVADARSTRHTWTAALELVLPDVIGAAATGSPKSAVLEVDGKLQGLIDDLLSRSPAFRRQWQRLSRVPRLTMRLELVHAQHVLDAHAATTVTAAPDGSLLAVVAIPGGVRLAELIAHEVEHVLERLDGVRVAHQHALGDASVRRAAGTFETARAVLVGQLVAAELQPR